MSTSSTLEMFWPSYQGTWEGSVSLSSTPTVDTPTAVTPSMNPESKAALAWVASAAAFLLVRVGRPVWC